MRPLRKIIEDLHVQLGRPTSFPQLQELIKEFDEKCCDKKTINKLRSNKNKLEQVRSINIKIIEIYANTISSVTSRLFAQLNLAEINTWPNAPTFTQLNDLWNCYSFFIVNNILEIKQLEQRNLQIERWIAVAKKLHQEQDFFNAHAIYASIVQRVVERLYKDGINCLSADALRRLSELRAIYSLPKPVLRERFIFPAVGPKLSDVYEAVTFSKANLEGQSTIRGRAQRQTINKVNDEHCLQLVKRMYNNYEEKIVEHKILAPLSMGILTYMPQARNLRVLKDLDTRCTKLEETISLLKTANATNPTPENATKIAELQKEFLSTKKSLRELSAEQEENDNALEAKTISIKPKNTLLSPSVLTLRVGSLIPRTPTLPTAPPPTTVTPAPTARTATPAPIVRTATPAAITTRGRSQSTSMLSGDAIPLDLHGSSIVPATMTRERSATIATIEDLSFFQVSHSKETFARSSSTRNILAEKRDIIKGTGSVRIKP